MNSGFFCVAKGKKSCSLHNIFEYINLILHTNKNRGWNTKAEPQVILIVLKFYIIKLFIINEFCIFLKGFKKLKKKLLLMAISLNSTYANAQEPGPQGNEQI